MYNSKYVIIGIVVFVVLATAPFWVSSFSSVEGEYKRPDIALPKNEKECIEPVEYMRAEHMQLLNDWRD